MDYNWFLTALAQSAAAIVGFTGGFLINRILNKEAEFYRLKDRNNDVLKRHEDCKQRLSHRYFEWYNKKLREEVLESSEFTALVREAKGAVDFEVIYQLGFSPFEKFEDLKEVVSKHWGVGKPKYPGIVLPTNPTITMGIRQQIVDERELINREIDSAQSVAIEASILERDIESSDKGNSSIFFTLWIIAALFFSAVIWPLSLTPVEGALSFTPVCEWPSTLLQGIATLKGTLLCIFSALFLAIVVFFAIRTRALFFEEVFRTTLLAVTKLSGYSEYLAVFEQNRERQDKRQRPIGDALNRSGT